MVGGAERHLSFFMVPGFFSIESADWLAFCFWKWGLRKELGWGGKLHYVACVRVCASWNFGVVLCRYVESMCDCMDNVEGFFFCKRYR